LGAQRVKALVEIADNKMKEELRELEGRRPNSTEKRDFAFSNLCLSEELKRLHEIEKEVQEISSVIELHTGIKYQLQNSNYRTTEQYNRLTLEAEKPFNEERKSIQDKWEGVKRSLWLCETLEQAKELVEIE